MADDNTKKPPISPFSMTEVTPEEAAVLDAAACIEIGIPVDDDNARYAMRVMDGRRLNFRDKESANTLRTWLAEHKAAGKGWGR